MLHGWRSAICCDPDIAGALVWPRGSRQRRKVLNNLILQEEKGVVVSGDNRKTSEQRPTASSISIARTT